MYRTDITGVHERSVRRRTDGRRASGGGVTDISGRARAGFRGLLAGPVAPTPRQRPRTLKTVQRQIVDYALQRRARLSSVHAGRAAVAEVCDASPYLLRAAKFHGRPSTTMCPICRKEQVTLVSWVFGERLGQVSGSARSNEEIARLATTAEEFSVHVVEVCRTCSWNHLVQSYVAGLPPQSTRRSRRVAK